MTSTAAVVSGSRRKRKCGNEIHKFDPTHNIWRSGWRPILGPKTKASGRDSLLTKGVNATLCSWVVGSVYTALGSAVFMGTRGVYMSSIYDGSTVYLADIGHFLCCLSALFIGNV